MGVRAESPNTLALGNLATHSSRPLATEPGDPFFTLTHKMGPAGFDGQFVQFDPITGRQITPDQK